MVVLFKSMMQVNFIPAHALSRTYTSRAFERASPVDLALVHGQEQKPSSREPGMQGRPHTKHVTMSHRAHARRVIAFDGACAERPVPAEPFRQLDDARPVVRSYQHIV